MNNAQSIETQSNSLKKLRTAQNEHDTKLTEAREEQAKVRAEVSKRERRIRKQEKTLEAKVPCHEFRSNLLDSDNSLSNLVWWLWRLK